MSSNLVVPVALGLQGNVTRRRRHTDVLPAGDDHHVVRLKLTVDISRLPSPLRYELSSTTRRASSNTYEVDFPLSILPELHKVIGNAIRSDEQSILRGDDHEHVLVFLADGVTAFLNDLVAGTLESARGLYTVYASLLLREEKAPEPAPGQSTVTSRNRQQQEESRAAVITETSCPIYLKHFVHGERVQLTYCGHPFHRRCLERWLHLKAHCPLCRSDMPLV